MYLSELKLIKTAGVLSANAGFIHRIGKAKLSYLSAYSPLSSLLHKTSWDIINLVSTK